MSQTCFTPASDPAARLQCRHVFPDGHRCGSPCLRRESFCYYHHTTRRPVEEPAARKARLATYVFPATEITHRSGIQAALGQVLERVASNDLTPRRAGILLYGLQIATLSLPRLAVPIAEAARNMVEEVIEDPQLGTLAPETELLTPEADDPIRRLLDSIANPPDDPELATSDLSEPDLTEPDLTETDDPELANSDTQLAESVLRTIQGVAATPAPPFACHSRREPASRTGISLPTTHYPLPTTHCSTARPPAPGTDG